MTDREKELCEKMPYLYPRNAWTGEPVEDAEWTEADALPPGWKELFIQMCEDIREPLERAGLLNTFYFTQVKEKYATMRAYNSGATEEVLEIIANYEFLSEYVCETCGRPATKQTDDWVMSICDECCKNLHTVYISELEFNPVREYIQFSKEGKIHHKVDCSDIWHRYLERIGYEM